MKEDDIKVLGVLKGLVKNVEDGKITLTTGSIMQNEDGTEEYNICGIRKKDIKDDWKDLNIKDIPSDFFDNENYEVEIKEGNDSYCSHGKVDVYAKLLVIKYLSSKNEEYRYRLKSEVVKKCTATKNGFSFENTTSYTCSVCGNIAVKESSAYCSDCGNKIVDFKADIEG